MMVAAPVAAVRAAVVAIAVMAARHPIIPLACRLALLLLGALLQQCVLRFCTFLRVLLQPATVMAVRSTTTAPIGTATAVMCAGAATTAAIVGVLRRTALTPNTVALAARDARAPSAEEGRVV